LFFPIGWIPDIYINPSNNGNLQSTHYRYIDRAEKRTNEEFFELLLEEKQNALSKKKQK